jgi:hypothetical protein
LADQGQLDEDGEEEEDAEVYISMALRQRSRVLTRQR